MKPQDKHGAFIYDEVLEGCLTYGCEKKVAENAAQEAVARWQTDDYFSVPDLIEELISRESFDV